MTTTAKPTDGRVSVPIAMPFKISGVVIWVLNITIDLIPHPARPGDWIADAMHVEGRVHPDRATPSQWVRVEHDHLLYRQVMIDILSGRRDYLDAFWERLRPDLSSTNKGAN